MSFKKPKSKEYRIHVVRTIDNLIVETYVTGVRDVISVPINEAKRAIDNRLKAGHHIATDDRGIAKEYNLEMITSGYSNHPI